jgi:hypothetical protein
VKPKKLRKLYAAKLRWEQKKLQMPYWHIDYPHEISKLVVIYAIR